jgi:anti-anti-sigma factor
MFQMTKKGTISVLSGNDPLTDEHLADVAVVCDRCYGQGQPKIVVDLKQVPLIDSRGLEWLLDQRDRCLRDGGLFLLATPSPLCQDILRVTELESQFTIFPDLLAALGSFSR